MKLKPEKKVEQILWAWLKTKGINIEEIYFNSKNSLNCKIFKVKPRKNGIPDFIICINYFGKKQYVAIEIKDASNDKNVHDSQKIITKYYKNFIEEKTKYFIKDKEIKINYFAIATQFSQQGKLFKKENIESNETGRKGDGWTNITVPRLEYNKSKSFSRTLFSIFKDYRKEKGLKEIGGPGVGVFYSDVLLNYDKNILEVEYGHIGKPILFCVKYGKKNEKNEWVQRMMKL